MIASTKDFLGDVKAELIDYIRGLFTNRTYIVPLHGEPVIHEFVRELKKKTDSPELSDNDAQKVSEFWNDFDHHYRFLSRYPATFLASHVVELKWRGDIARSTVYKIKIYCRTKRKLVMAASFTGLPSLQ